MSATTNDLHGARVLVTGAAGFIGSHLCRALAARGASVVALTYGAATAHSGPEERHEIDLRDRDAVRTLVRAASPDFVAHLAALRLGTGLADIVPSYQANLLPTAHLAEAVLETGGVRRFVYLSSAEEYGRASVPFDPAAREAPLTSYGLSKLAATQLLQALSSSYGLPALVLRATVVYGPGQAPSMFIPALVRALLAGESFPMTAGTQTRDFVYVDDVVDGIVRALTMTERHDSALHLSAGQGVAIRDVARLAAAAVGPGAYGLLQLDAVPYREGEAMAYWADNTESRIRLGWTPRVSLEEGLRRTVAYFRGDTGGV